MQLAKMGVRGDTHLVLFSEESGILKDDARSPFWRVFFEHLIRLSSSTSKRVQY